MAGVPVGGVWPAGAEQGSRQGGGPRARGGHQGRRLRQAHGHSTEHHLSQVGLEPHVVLRAVTARSPLVPHHTGRLGLDTRRSLSTLRFCLCVQLNAASMPGLLSNIICPNVTTIKMCDLGTCSSRPERDRAVDERQRDDRGHDANGRAHERCVPIHIRQLS
jgi:hypothetical protein